MPKLGYGVYQVTSEECERCVLDAISVGYRSIDTAQAYGNEEGVGNAIEKCGVPREELFITTKVWISNGGYEKAKASIEESLRKLKTKYIDLLLIHQPFNDYYGTYRAMEEAYKEGKPAQIALRFLLQSDVVVIPKSTHKERMLENINVFDFKLTEDDMKSIRALDEKESAFFSHYDPATVEMLTGLVR